MPNSICIIMCRQTGADPMVVDNTFRSNRGGGMHIIDYALGH